MRSLLLTLSLLLSLSSLAQWDWSIRGGSSNLLQRPTDYNGVNYLETDQAGNVYFMAIIGGGGIECGEESLTGYSNVGQGATVDILIASYTANGQYRWSKVIGGHLNDYGYALKADSLGHVYATGRVTNPYNNPVGPPDTPLHFDTDTVLPRVPYDSNFAYIEDTLRQSMFLAKYDTSGALEWLVLPEPDTVTQKNMLVTTSYSLGLDIDPTGNLHWLCYLRPGKFQWEQDSIITQAGVYVVEYNGQGEQVGLTPISMNATTGMFLTVIWGHHTNFRRNHTTGEFVIAGINEAPSNNGWITIDGDTLQSDSYIASFSSSGQLQWLHESMGVDEMQIEALDLDMSGNIYITGAVKRNTILAGNVYTSPVGTVSPFVTALDATGSHLWSSMAVPGGMSAGQGIEVDDGEVAITGYSGQMYWPLHTDTLKTAPNQGYDAFITRFEKVTGIPISTERTVTNFGGGSWGNAITAGPANTYYFGGNFDQGMYMGNDTLYKVGSQRSFFLTKYQCDVPEPSFSVSGNNDSNSVTLTYTGPLADSVQWFMGDGTQYWGDVVQHTYGADSVYRMCVRAYFECTDVMICGSIHAGSIGMREVAATDITFYPNPTSGQLTIDGLPEPGILRLYGIEGTLLNSEVTTESTHHMELGSYPAGVYVLEYQSRKGISTFRKVIVE